MMRVIFVWILKSLLDFKKDIGAKIFFLLTELHGINQKRQRNFIKTISSGCKYYIFPQLLQRETQKNIVGKQQEKN
jgi:hypothetical protein